MSVDEIPALERRSAVRCGRCLWLGYRSALTADGTYRDVLKRRCPRCGFPVVLDMFHTGGVYLLCFHDSITLMPRPYPNGKKPGHYLGWCSPLNFTRRICYHRTGTTTPLLREVVALGLLPIVARTWPGRDKTFERRMKKRGPARLCPRCLWGVGLVPKPRYPSPQAIERIVSGPVS